MSEFTGAWGANPGPPPPGNPGPSPPGTFPQAHAASPGWGAAPDWGAGAAGWGAETQDNQGWSVAPAGPGWQGAGAADAGWGQPATPGWGQAPAQGGWEQTPAAGNWSQAPAQGAWEQVAAPSGWAPPPADEAWGQQPTAFQPNPDAAWGQPAPTPAWGASDSPGWGGTTAPPPAPDTVWGGTASPADPEVAWGTTAAPAWPTPEPAALPVVPLSAPEETPEAIVFPAFSPDMAIPAFAPPEDPEDGGHAAGAIAPPEPEIAYEVEDEPLTEYVDDLPHPEPANEVAPAAEAWSAPPAEPEPVATWEASEAAEMLDFLADFEAISAPADAPASDPLASLEAHGARFIDDLPGRGAVPAIEVKAEVVPAVDANFFDAFFSEIQAADPEPVFAPEPLPEVVQAAAPLAVIEPEPVVAPEPKAWEAAEAEGEPEPFAFVETEPAITPEVESFDFAQPEAEPTAWDAQADFAPVEPEVVAAAGDVAAWDGSADDTAWDAPTSVEMETAAWDAPAVESAGDALNWDNDSTDWGMEVPTLAAEPEPTWDAEGPTLAVEVEPWETEASEAVEESWDAAPTLVEEADPWDAVPPELAEEPEPWDYGASPEAIQRETPEEVIAADDAAWGLPETSAVEALTKDPVVAIADEWPDGAEAPAEAFTEGEADEAVPHVEETPLEADDVAYGDDPAAYAEDAAPGDASTAYADEVVDGDDPAAYGEEAAYGDDPAAYAEAAVLEADTPADPIDTAAETIQIPVELNDPALWDDGTESLDTEGGAVAAAGDDDFNDDFAPDDEEDASFLRRIPLPRGRMAVATAASVALLAGVGGGGYLIFNRDDSILPDMQAAIASIPVVGEMLVGAPENAESPPPGDTEVATNGDGETTNIPPKKPAPESPPPSPTDEQPTGEQQPDEAAKPVAHDVAKGPSMPNPAVASAKPKNVKPNNQGATGRKYPPEVPLVLIAPLPPRDNQVVKGTALQPPPIPRETPTPDYDLKIVSKNTARITENAMFDRWRLMGITAAYEGNVESAIKYFTLAQRLRPDDASIDGWIKAMTLMPKDGGDKGHGAPNPVENVAPTDSPEEAQIKARDRLIRMQMEGLGKAPNTYQPPTPPPGQKTRGRGAPKVPKPPTLPSDNRDYETKPAPILAPPRLE